jgi:hypothetical protein
LIVGCLRFIEDAPQVRWRSTGDRAILWHELKNLQKGIKTLLEASHDHLLVTPPSHFKPQKVRGWLGGFCERGIVYNSNDSRTANSVKLNFRKFRGLEKRQIINTTSGGISYLGGGFGLSKVKQANLTKPEPKSDFSRNEKNSNEF